MNFKTTTLKPFGIMLEPEIEGQKIQTLDLSVLKHLFEEEHLIVLRGFEGFQSADDFAAYCETWGKVSLWPFGKVLELKEQQKPKDHIFDHSYVPLHWDGMYREQVPEVQIFQCVSAPGEGHGGRTTFTHTERVFRAASEDVQRSWAAVKGVYKRKMEFYDSKTIAPLVDKHPTRGFPVIRFCEPPIKDDQGFLNHPNFEFTGVETGNANRLMSDLRKALYSPEFFYAHEWETGDIVISDNYTLLHGREAFTSGAPRHLRRVQVLGEPALDNPHLVYTR